MCDESCVSQGGFGSCVSIYQLVNVARSIADAGLPVPGTQLLSHMKIMWGIHKLDFSLALLFFLPLGKWPYEQLLCVTEIINSAVWVEGHSVWLRDHVHVCWGRGRTMQVGEPVLRTTKLVINLILCIKLHVFSQCQGWFERACGRKQMEGSWETLTLTHWIQFWGNIKQNCNC